MRKQRLLPSDGSALAVALLLLCLALVGTMAWQAHQANRSHRRVAEEILHDYAALAAEEMVQRSAADLSLYGYYPLLVALEGHAERELPTKAQLLAGDTRLEQASPLLGTLFRYVPHTESLESRGAAMAAAERQALLRLLSSAPPAESRADRYRTRLREIDGQNYAFSFVLPAGGEGALNGFTVRMDALGPWFGRAFERAPLLPPTLTERGVDNDLLRIDIIDPSSQVLYGFGSELPPARSPYEPVLRVVRPFAEAGRGVLEGLSVRATLDQTAAPRLIIGGLPKSRVPMLSALVLLTSGLLLTAILQLRRARALARLRADFVSEVSHELRTPLTQIRMFSETLLLGRVRTEEEGRRSLEIIDQEARRLGHLVENVLCFSRGERGALELRLEPLELACWLRTQVAGLSPLASSRDMHIRCSAIDGVRVEVDEDALRQILLNLLDNAFKYGPRGQEVRVGMELAENAVQLVVEDRGPGVPRRQQERIWRSFHRLRRDRGSAVAGTGIGLAVVRQLSELMGGRAWVEGRHGGGARFVVQLRRLSPADHINARDGVAAAATSEAAI